MDLFDGECKYDCLYLFTMASLNIYGKITNINVGMTISEAISAQGMHPDAYLYLINGIPVPMDIIPPSNAEVKVISVASGG